MSKCYLCGKKAIIHIDIPVCGTCDNEYLKQNTEDASKVHWDEKNRRWDDGKA